MNCRVIYCKCEGCRETMSLSWAIPDGVKLLELPPPIPDEAKFSDYPDAFDLAGIPREPGTEYLINTRVKVSKEPKTCPFCSVPCNKPHCPYTKEKK